MTAFAPQSASRNNQIWGALRPGGFALSKWLVLVEAAVQRPLRERRILVDKRYERESYKWHIQSFLPDTRHSAPPPMPVFKKDGMR